MAPDHRSGERSQELHLLHRSQGRHGLRGHRRYDAMHRGALRPQVGDPGALACIYTRASCSCPSCPTDNYIGARATLFHAPRAEGGACARGAWPFSLGGRQPGGGQLLGSQHFSSRPEGCKSQCTWGLHWGILITSLMHSTRGQGKRFVCS